MSKRKHSKQPSSEPAIQEHGPLLTEPVASPSAAPSPRTESLSLSDIRTAVLKAHTKTAHTIADLEAWRDEIEATIAFLKARGR